MELFCSDNVNPSRRTWCYLDVTTALWHVLFAVIFTALLLWRCAARNVRKPGPASLLPYHAVRWLVYVALVVAALAEAGDAALSVDVDGGRAQRVAVVAASAWLALIVAMVFYQHVESGGATPLLALSLLYWGCLLGLKVTKLVHLHTLGLTHRHLVVVVTWMFALAYLVLVLVEVHLVCSSKYLCPSDRDQLVQDDATFERRFLYNEATLLSKATFFWIWPMVWFGYKKPLDIDDLGKLPEPEQADTVYNQFYKVYSSDKVRPEERQKTVFLWRCFIKSFTGFIVWSVILKLLADIVEFVAPLSIGSVINYVIMRQNMTNTLYGNANSTASNGINATELSGINATTPWDAVNATESSTIMDNVTEMPYFESLPIDEYITVEEFFRNGYILIVVVLFSTLLQSTLSNAFFQCGIIAGIRGRTAIQMMLYNKALRLSTSQPEGKGLDIGAIVNHMTNDTFNLMMCFMMGHFLWAIPIKISLLLIFLYREIGYSALLGVSVILFIMPLQFLVGKFMAKVQKKTLEVTDQRLKKTNELLQSMKLLKLYAWEFLFSEHIHDYRTKELKLLLRDVLLGTTNNFLTRTSSVFMTLVAFGVYAAVEGKPLTPSVVFTTLALFGQLAVPLFILPITFPVVINAVVSSKRLNTFFSMATEIEEKVVKRYDPNNTTTFEFDPQTGSVMLNVTLNNEKPRTRDTEILSSDSDEEVDGNPCVTVEMENSSFAWDVEKKEPIVSNLTTVIPNGGLTIIVGPTGCGKSSFVSALLGEMNLIEGFVKWTRNVPVAYTPQKPWLLNATLRENILFGTAYDAKRYRQVIDACALQPDIDLLPGGDMTEIGEKGVNLSGGQKQRVAVARAFYSTCKTVILDDPLSALDAQVGLHVFEEGIKKLLLHYKCTVILVTHRLQFLPQADKIIALDDGKINHQGTLTEIESCNPELCNSWKETMNLEEMECKNKNAGEKTQEERRQLMRSLSRVERSLSISEEPSLRQLQRQLSIDSAHIPASEYFDDSSYPIQRAQRLDSLASQGSHGSSPNVNGSQNLHRKHSLLQRMRSINSTKSATVNQETENTEEEKGKLMTEEDRFRGDVSMQVYLTYLKACGVFLCVIVLIGAITANGCSLGKDYWLSRWSDNSEKQLLEGKMQTDEELYYYLGIYVLLSLLYIIISLFSNICVHVGGLRAQKSLHRSILNNVIQCPMRFFDTTPVGRILNRFSSDIITLDKRLTPTLQMLLQFSLLCLSAIVINAFVSIYFLFAAIPLILSYYLIQRFFRATSRELQRLDSITKSPVYAHFSETLNGLTTIRAFRQENQFRKSFGDHINENNNVFYLLHSANRWLGISLDYLGAGIVFSSSMIAVTAAIHGAITPGLVGLAMAYSLIFPIYMNWLVRNITDTEMLMSSVERIDYYTKLPIEEYKGTVDPPKTWPEAGEIRLENISLRYDASLDPVINGLTLRIRPGEKIGVCGRTGSGKSSLTLGLFRLIDMFEGQIYIDDVDISKVSLSTLRARLSIIPQDAVLFTGSVRGNLDPEKTHEDEELWKTLEMAQLKDVVTKLPKGLESEVVEGGENFSVGQRQLFCLARAILRQSQIVVMDEATASLDNETDQAVQKVMAEAFSHCTIFTIAHRLTTILDYDTILVLDAGQVVEMGSPSELLKKPNGQFAELARAHN